MTRYWAPGFRESGIAAGPDGAPWFADDWNNMIGRMTTAVTPQITATSTAR